MSLRDLAEQENATGPRLELELGADGGSFSGYVTDSDGPDAFTEFYELTGLDPVEWPLDRGSLRVSMWQQASKEDGVSWLRSYRGNLYRTTVAVLDAAEVAALLRQARNVPKVRLKDASDATRVVVLSDLQVGKVDRHGGTKELLARVSSVVDGLVETAVKERCERLVIVDPGDLIEGFENTSSQAYTNDLSLPGMLRIARGVLVDVVTRLAAVHESTTVVTCPSNHAAWRRGKGSLGRPGDDFGLDVHLAVRDVLARDSRFENVSWVLPEHDWTETTFLPVEDIVMAVTHGHRARSGKFSEWWKGQAGSSSQAHEATVVVSGHYHSFVAESLGVNTVGLERLHVQAPALDGGSAWWANISGDESAPGAVTFVLEGTDWRSLRLVRPVMVV